MGDGGRRGGMKGCGGVEVLSAGRKWKEVEKFREDRWNREEGARRKERK